MLHPSKYDTFTLLSIDPGTGNLGTAIHTVNVKEKTIHTEVAKTYNAYRKRYFNEHYDIIEERFDAVHARLKAHQDSLERLIEQHGVHVIVCESAWAGKNISAFNALVQCIVMIQHMLGKYPTIPFVLITPNEAKYAIGMTKIKGQGKEGVVKALRALLKRKPKSPLSLDRSIDLERLDEHEVDAIAIGYGFFKKSMGI